MSLTLLHICTQDAWKAARRVGAYRAASLETEGFIHCSTPPQAVETANRHFAGRDDLILLSINAEKVTAEIKYELAAHGGMYPHIYGPLNVAAVTDAIPFPRSEDGTFALPQCFL